jgi:hypothetical protein
VNCTTHDENVGATFVNITGGTGFKMLCNYIYRFGSCGAKWTYFRHAQVHGTVGTEMGFLEIGRPALVVHCSRSAAGHALHKWE